MTSSRKNLGKKKATDQGRENKNQAIVLPKRESDLPGCGVVRFEVRGLSFCSTGFKVCGWGLVESVVKSVDGVLLNSV